MNGAGRVFGWVQTYFLQPWASVAAYSLLQGGNPDLLQTQMHVQVKSKHVFHEGKCYKFREKCSVKLAVNRRVSKIMRKYIMFNVKIIVWRQCPCLIEPLR